MHDLDYRYPGSKGIAGHAAWIISHFPIHVFYAEPFAGKGAVFRHKAPALRSYICDLDDEVCRWWHQLSHPGTIIQMGDGVRWVELAAEWGPEDLMVYCDPPYLLRTRVKQKLYRHEMSDEQHERLLRALQRLSGPAAISGYRSELYDDLLTGWQRDEREVMTRGGTTRTDCLWINRAAVDRPSSEPLMKYSQLGGNYIERGRVATKIKAWQKRLAKMDAVERRALVLGMIEQEQRRGRHL